MKQIALDHILIFKTNIRNSDEKYKLGILFDTNPLIEEWNVDCEDVDCVLRVVSQKLKVKQIIDIVTNAGFNCVEMEE